MKVFGFIINFICSLAVGGILALTFGFAGLLIGISLSLISYYVMKWVAIASTAPISYLTESDIGIWISQSFAPWLINYVAWIFIAFSIASNFD